MKFFYLLISVCIISFIIYYNIKISTRWNTILLSIAIGIYSLFIFINVVMTKTTYITNDGVRLGNAQRDTYDTFKFRRKAIFIKWRDIGYIKITRKEVRKPFHYTLIDYIIIKIKNDKRIDSFIAQPKEFVEALKKIGKGKLLSKDSKYI